MADKTLKDVSEIMRNIDLCMLTTTTSDGALASRPMSNNGDVEYDGNSYFFTWEGSRTVSDIELDNGVNLTFQGDNGIFISVTGKGEVSRSREEMEEHWVSDLDKWFENGLDTPGIAMVTVKAKRIKYWQGEEDGEVKL
ncbi:pyridoxamine 5'-phosphate oxidase family protein [Dyadobacter sp. CY326]|uniref:pyridoxamine 5'-phosphate oxidase family protein n=1 Tax=Dyadobacter sp. CY326 TaxID=2907300 RepID=UPI001F4342EB|nr:pyridoxamine 5'-phosphate oxidase family protein [Dyadobacter sp. CY326]MCE7066401.1 pyridoxamine 5'-phosphate oxidase family protein [Dyadobacter sp. CY326]